MAKKLRLNSRKIVINDHTRLFIEQDTIACADIYDYHSCVVLGNVTMPKPQDEIVYCPDPGMANKFTILGRVEGERGQGSSDLVTNLTTAKSILRKYYDKRCSFKMQVHMGECDSPSNFAKFDKALLFSGVEITDYAISNPMTGTQADRSAVTESASFSFEEMLEVTQPEFIEFTSGIVKAGPILDSFTFCGDYTCSLCEGHAGRYFVQLLSCGSELEPCNRMRVIYTKDEGRTWNISNIAICDSLSCEQPVNRNVTEDSDKYFHSSIDYAYATSTIAIIERGVKTLDKTLLTGNAILRAYTKDGTAFFVGENGRFFVSRHGITTRLVNTVLEVSKDILSIDSRDGYEFVAGAEDGVTYYGNIDNEITSIILPTTNPIHQIAKINDCSYVTSNGSDGGFLYTDGKVEKMGAIHGTITRFKFYNEDIGYATTLLRDVNYIWQTVDGGQNWQRLETTLDASYVITSISICPINHNLISIAGRKLPTVVLEADHIDPFKLWDCEGEGFVIMAV